MMKELTDSTMIDGEYRHVVALMADLVQSSRITEELGAERGFLLIREVMQIMAEAADAEGGTVINYVGDGVFAIFGAPRATESAGLDACRAALRMRDGLRAKGGFLEERHGVRPEVRIGLAEGEVLVLRGEGGDRIEASGSAVNFAARLQDLAEAGEVVCSADLRENLAGLVISESKGRFDIKGYSGAREVHTILALDQEASQQQARRRIIHATFVGRAAEIERLRTWGARNENAPVICLIEGPAGMGKSRTLQAYVETMDGRVRTLVGQCIQTDGRRSLAPLIDILRGEIGWQAGMSPQTITAELMKLLPGRRAPSELLVQIMSGVSGASEVSDRHAAAVTMQDDIRDILHLVGTRRDRLLVIEDAHWLDDLSSHVLKSAALTARGEFRLLVTARANETRGWLMDKRWLHVELPALTRSDVSVMASEMLGEDAGDAGLLDVVATKSEGNPLFIEEILRHVHRTGKSEPQAIGSIQNLVFSRFDSLEADIKDALRLAATMGRSFGEGPLRAAAGRDALGGRVLLRDTGGLLEEAPGAGRLRFAHVLIRDIIYSSIPESQRDGFHLRVARAIEALDPASEFRSNEELADHFEAAGETGKAIHYHAEAAKAEFQTYALALCEARMERVFALIEQSGVDVPDAVFSDLMETRVRCLDLIGAFGGLRALVEAQAEKVTDPGARMICRILHSKSLCHGGFYDAAIDIGYEAIAEAEARGEAHALAFARVVQMRNLMDADTGAPGEIERLFEQTADVPEAASDRQIAYMRLYIMCAFHRRHGRFAQAWALNEELKALGVSDNDTRGIGYGAWSEAVLQRFLQDNEGVMAAATIAVKNTIPGTSDRAVADTALLMSRIEAGEAGGPDDFDRIIQISDANDNYPLRNAALLQQVIAHFRFGNMRTGWRLLQEALEKFKDTTTAEHQMFTRIAMAEIWLALAGLMPSDRERPKMALGDIAFVLRLRLRAKREAKAALAHARAAMEAAGAGGFLDARITLGEGLLVAKRDAGEAREKFQRARDLFKAEGMDAEVARVDRIIADLA